MSTQVGHKLSQTLKSDVSSKVRSRGSSYARRGAVDVGEVNERGVDAVVKGSQSYDVTIRFDTSGSGVEGQTDVVVRAACSCPYFNRGEVCKHIWATLVDIEREDSDVGTPMVAAEASTSLIADADVLADNLLDDLGEDDDLDDEEDSEDNAFFSGRIDLDNLDLENMPDFVKQMVKQQIAGSGRDTLGGSGKDSSHGPSNAPPPPAWQSALNSVVYARHRFEPRPELHWPSDRQIVYMVDLKASKYDTDLAVEVMFRQPKKNGQWSKPQTRRLDHQLVEQLPDPDDRRILSVLTGANNKYETNPYSPQNVGVSPRVSLTAATQRMVLEMMGRTGRCFARPERSGVDPESWQSLDWHDQPTWSLALRLERSGEAGHAGRADAEDDLDGNAHEQAGQTKAEKKADDKSIRASEPQAVTDRQTEREGDIETDTRPYVLRGQLVGGDQRIPLDQPRLITAGGVVVIDDCLMAFDNPASTPWIDMLSDKGDLTVPAEHVDDFLETLFRAPSVPPIELPEELQLQRVGPQRPTYELHIRNPDQRRARNQSADDLCANLTFWYGDKAVFDDTPASTVYEREGRQLIEREREAEDHAWGRLRELGFRPPSFALAGEGADLVIARRHLANAVTTLTGENWHVEAQGKLHRQPSALDMDMRSSGIDWFELHGQAEFDGQFVGLPRLLRAVQKGEKTIELDDGSIGMLPEDWLKRYAPLANLGQVVEGRGNGQTSGEPSEDHLRLRPTQIGLIDALLSEMPEIDHDKKTAQARQRLAGFTGIKPRQSTRGFDGELRPYQREGLGWLHFLNKLGFGGCLADDMGLGKTIQVLALLESRRQRRRRDKGQTPPAIVVAPRSLMHNWAAEAKRFTPDLRVLTHTGQERFDGMTKKLSQKYTQVAQASGLCWPAGPNLAQFRASPEHSRDGCATFEIDSKCLTHEASTKAQANDAPEGETHGKAKTKGQANAHGEPPTAGDHTADTASDSTPDITPELKALSDAETTSVEHFNDYDLILTTYGTLRQDIAVVKDQPFDYAVLDESQAIKNPKTATAKAVRLLQADHRLALSGTPIENHLGELASLFDFLNPGMLGHSKAWLGATGANGTGHGKSKGKANANANYANANGNVNGKSNTHPDASANGKSTANGQAQANVEDDPQAAQRQLLAKAVRPFVLRRTKQQVAADLPEKTEQTIHCELGSAQRKLYNELRAHYRANLLGRVSEVGLNRSKIQVLEALLRLRQAACHPGLIDKNRTDESSAKIDTLMPQLLETVEEGHKVLVFSQFTQFLSIVRKQLEAEGIEHEYLDGRTRKRGERVERFQTDPECKLFLISLKAGGTGLNLTAADYVFLLDPWWNPAVESQAIDRVHRIGQDKRVFANRLIAQDTVEEKVVELQNSKRDLAESIIRADRNVVRDLTVDDLHHLLA